LSGFGEKPRAFEANPVSAGVFARGGRGPVRQGGPELWAAIDVIKVDGPMDYIQQPVIEEMAFDL